MPPKKSTGTTKKKEGANAAGSELDIQEKVKLSMYTCNSLQLQLGNDNEILVLID